ncbi:PUA-like domain-containing protein [Armillaria nabsnona]|nr:PUA-like domain-containing protein [Armillaria nabsnona]
MTYTDEAFRFKKTRKSGKEELRIVKDYRNIDVDKPKEREGCRKPIADPATVGKIEGQPVGTWYMDRMAALEPGVHGSLRRGIYSYKGSAQSVVLSDGYEEFNKDKGDRIRLCGEGGRSKDGTMQVKDQEYTHGNKALQLDQPVRVIRGYRLHSKYAPNNGFRYGGLYKVTACYQKRDENGFKVILFKLERIPGQLPIGTWGKFWAYPESNAPTEMPEPSTPKKSLFPPRAKLPSFNKSSTSSYTLPANWQQVALNQSYPTHLNSDSGAPLSPVKVENYCDDTLQYPVKAASPDIAISSISLLQYPEVDVKVGGTHTSAKPPLRVKAESPPPARKRSGSTISDPLPRKRQKVSNAPRPRVKAESPPPFSLSECGPQKSKYSGMENCGIFLPHLCSPFISSISSVPSATC